MTTCIDSEMYKDFLYENTTFLFESLYFCYPRILYKSNITLRYLVRRELQHTYGLKDIFKLTRRLRASLLINFFVLIKIIYYRYCNDVEDEMLFIWVLACFVALFLLFEFSIGFFNLIGDYKLFLANISYIQSN